MTTQPKKTEIEVIHQKADFLNDAFLIFRPNDFPLFLKPIRCKVPQTCILTGREIAPGQYAYPCYSNPPRLSPYGPEKCHVGAALRKGDSILPAGFYAARIPSTEALKRRGVKIEDTRKKALGQLTNKLLEGRKS